MFRVDFKRLIADLLPLWLRRPLVFGILRAGLIGIEDVYNMFSASRRDDNFRLTHNGQVCHLRGMLNSCFGMGFGIGDVRSDGEWLFAVGEDGVHIPLASGEDGVDVPVVYSGQALNAERNDFVVFVPEEVWWRLDQVRAMVERYKLVSKRAYYVRIGWSQPESDVPGWTPDVLNRLIKE